MIDYVLQYLKTEDIYLIIVPVLIGLVTVILITILYKAIKTKDNRWKINIDVNQIRLVQKDAIDDWVNNLDKRLKKQGVHIKTKRLIVINIIVVITIFVLSINTFHNLTASLLLSLTIVTIPEYLINLLEDRYKRKVEDNMIVAVRIFTTEFIKTKSLDKCFAAIASRVVDPIGKYFADAYNEMLSGYKMDKVLEKLATKIDSEYWIMYVQLIHQVRVNSHVIKLFPELVSRIEDHIELSRSNNASLAGERVMALIMAVIPIPAYFFMRSIVPETTTFVTQTGIGRLLVTIAFLSIFIFVVLDRLLRRVE